jgi:hypothetical protein
MSTERDGSYKACRQVNPDMKISDSSLNQRLSEESLCSLLFSGSSWKQIIS